MKTPDLNDPHALDSATTTILKGTEPIKSNAISNHSSAIDPLHRDPTEETQLQDNKLTAKEMN